MSGWRTIHREGEVDLSGDDTDPTKARIVLDFLQLWLESERRLEVEDVEDLSIKVRVTWMAK